jgi:hypothetical protein
MPKRNREQECPLPLIKKARLTDTVQLTQDVIPENTLITLEATCEESNNNQQVNDTYETDYILTNCQVKSQDDALVGSCTLYADSVNVSNHVEIINSTSTDINTSLETIQEQHLNKKHTCSFIDLPSHLVHYILCFIPQVLLLPIQFLIQYPHKTWSTRIYDPFKIREAIFPVYTRTTDYNQMVSLFQTFRNRCNMYYIVLSHIYIRANQQFERVTLPNNGQWMIKTSHDEALEFIKHDQFTRSNIVLRVATIIEYHLTSWKHLLQVPHIQAIRDRLQVESLYLSDQVKDDTFTILSMLLPRQFKEVYYNVRAFMQRGIDYLKQIRAREVGFSGIRSTSDLSLLTDYFASSAFSYTTAIDIHFQYPKNVFPAVEETSAYNSSQNNSITPNKNQQQPLKSSDNRIEEEEYREHYLQERVMFNHLLANKNIKKLVLHDNNLVSLDKNLLHGLDMLELYYCGFGLGCLGDALSDLLTLNITYLIIHRSKGASNILVTPSLLKSLQDTNIKYIEFSGVIQVSKLSAIQYILGAPFQCISIFHKYDLFDQAIVDNDIETVKNWVQESERPVSSFQIETTCVDDDEDNEPIGVTYTVTLLVLF